MKKTAALHVKFSQHIVRDLFIIHPNDGFDLGMMTKSYPVQWCSGLPATEFVQGKNGTVAAATVELRNECPHQALEMNINHWKDIGSPSHAVMFYDGSRIYICPLKKTAEKD